MLLKRLPRRYLHPEPDAHPTAVIRTVPVWGLNNLRPEHGLVRIAPVYLNRRGDVATSATSAYGYVGVRARRASDGELVLVVGWNENILPEVHFQSRFTHWFDKLAGITRRIRVEIEDPP